MSHCIDSLSEKKMRSALIVGSLVAFAAHRDAVRPEPRTTDACYVAEVTMIVDNVADYRFHRVVVAGIRKLNVTPNATNGGCGVQDTGLRDGLLRAIDTHLGALNIKAPRVRSNLELRNPSLDVVRREIANIATRAREHAGEFTRVEVLVLSKDLTSGSEEVPLTPFAGNAAEAATCSADNQGLERAGAHYRWGC
jgi:hypothetical protein